MPAPGRFAWLPGRPQPQGCQGHSPHASSRSR